MTRQSLSNVTIARQLVEELEWPLERTRPSVRAGILERWRQSLSTTVAITKFEDLAPVMIGKLAILLADRHPELEWVDLDKEAGGGYWFCEKCLHGSVGLGWFLECECD